MYCLFLFIQSISFPKQAPYKGFSIVVTWAFALLSRHFESLLTLVRNNAI